MNKYYDSFHKIKRQLNKEDQQILSSLDLKAMSIGSRISGIIKMIIVFPLLPFLILSKVATFLILLLSEKLLSKLFFCNSDYWRFLILNRAAKKLFKDKKY